MESIFNIFYIRTEEEFNFHALSVFNHQWKVNNIYRKYCDLTGCDPGKVKHYREIPFLPVSFFKSHDVVCGSSGNEMIFYSSGTTGQTKSRHIVADPEIYRQSLRNSFRIFFGEFSEYEIFGLMPSPPENPGSSLIFMVNEWIKESGSINSGFYLDDQELLAARLKDHPDKKKLLIGLSYALLDFAGKYSFRMENTVVMETGGMKGRRREMIREELHSVLKNAFGLNVICSEYGMTELLSQAYSKGDGIFRSPPWMKILIRDADDPFSLVPDGKSGGINVIDLANLHSCSFIAIQDLGKVHAGGSFEVLGRFDDSEARGCNLMIS